MKQYLIPAVIVAALSTPVAAATFSFEENDAPGGDFADVTATSNFNVGSSTAGFSSVNGTLNGQCNAGDCNAQINPFEDSQDSFAFTIEAGFELVNIFAFSEGFGPTDFQYGIALYEPPQGAGFNNIGIGFFEVNDGGQVTDGTIFGAGTYFVSAFGAGATSNGAYNMFWGLDIQVREATTSPVPLPAAAPLLLGALGVFGAMRRRKSKTA